MVAVLVGAVVDNVLLVVGVKMLNEVHLAKRPTTSQNSVRSQILKRHGSMEDKEAGVVAARHLGVPLSSTQNCPAGQLWDDSGGQAAICGVSINKGEEEGIVVLRSIGNGNGDGSSGGGKTAGKHRGMSSGAMQRCPFGQVRRLQGSSVGNGSSMMGRLG